MSSTDDESPWSGGGDAFRADNLANRYERALLHSASPGYRLDRLVNDPTALTDVVSFDLPLLGDISGLRVLHLQCHIGSHATSGA